MATFQARSLAFYAFILCFLASTALAAPPTVDVTIPDVGGQGGDVRKITISSTIVAIVLMVAGFIFAFFGHKFFKVTLFLTGFYVCATLAWIALKNLEPSNGYGSNAQLVYIGVSGAVGLIGGAFFLCFWRLGFAAIGGVAGFYLAMFILSWSTSGVITSGIGRTIFIIAFVIVGIVLTFFVERHVVILGTAIVGSGSFFVGLDNFVMTGFSEAFTAFLGGNHAALFGGGYQATGKVYGMLAGTLGMMVIGACFQYYTHRGSFVPKSHRPQPHQVQPAYQQV
ncbi:hypothetical protein BGZ93_007500 [Podila epicladia]|nr:hypothetical protein BGZ92_009503 [Podila epicladia]KAG0094194.1 hypothetical protein BGZ93_007500 [Podila epicladia]